MNGLKHNYSWVLTGLLSPAGNRANGPATPKRTVRSDQSPFSVSVWSSADTRWRGPSVSSAWCSPLCETSVVCVSVCSCERGSPVVFNLIILWLGPSKSDGWLLSSNNLFRCSSVDVGRERTVEVACVGTVQEVCLLMNRLLFFIVLVFPVTNYGPPVLPWRWISGKITDAE